MYTFFWQPRCIYLRVTILPETHSKSEPALPKHKTLTLFKVQNTSLNRSADSGLRDELISMSDLPPGWQGPQQTAWKKAHSASLIMFR